MISLYTGTPGSGKSLHAAQVIYDNLAFKRVNVIANFQVNMPMIWYSDKAYKKIKAGESRLNFRKKKAGHFYYFSDDVINPKLLIDFARKFHKPGKEGQTLLVLDECSADGLFNNRTWQNRDRSDWITFLRQHRKLGYTIIFIAQSDKLVDKAIRCFVEYEEKHRKLNNFKLFGKILAFLRGGSLFVSVQYWYSIRERIGKSFFNYKKWMGEFYDTYKVF